MLFPLLRASRRDRDRRRARQSGKSSRRARLRFERLEERLALAATSAFYSMPTNLAGVQGDVVSVPVSISHLSDTAGHAGLAGVDLVLTYDPAVFTVSASDVAQGSLLANSPASGTWFVTANTNTVGELLIIAASNIAATDITDTSGGILFNVAFHIKGNAPTGNSTIHVVVPPELSVNSLNSDAIDHNQGDTYVLNAADQVDGVVNIQTPAPITSLSIPTGLVGTSGQTITVPVNVGNPNPANSTGMISADAVLLYDPSVLSIAATGAVVAGSDLPATGWSLSYEADTSGNNLVDPTKAALSLHLVNTNSTPLTSTASGSLWLVTFTINAAADGTTALNLVPSAKVGAATTTTNLVGQNKAYQLTPAPTNAATDTIDGSIDASSLKIFASSPLQLTAGSPYADEIAAVAGGTTPYTSLQVSNFVAGTTGLTLANFTTNAANDAITLSGTPTAGTATLRVTVTDAAGAVLAQDLTLIVNAALGITPSLPAATAKAAYNKTITVTGGTRQFQTFQVTNFTAGTTGVTQQSITTDSAHGTVTISATPTAAGTFSFTVNVIDARGATLSQDYSIVVNGPLAFSVSSLPQATTGNTYHQTIGLLGGTQPYDALDVSDFDAGTTGLLASAITVSADKTTVTIDGTAHGAGTVTFSVSAQDAAGATITKNYSIAVRIGTEAGDGSLVIDGTSDEDSISVTFTSTELFFVTLNGTDNGSGWKTGTDPGRISKVIFHGGGGADTVIVTDTFSTRQVTLGGNALTLVGTDFELDVDAAESITVNGRASDSATITDTTNGGNIATTTSTDVSLADPKNTFLYQVSGFGSVVVNAAVGSNNTGYMHASAGDIWTATPTSATMAGTGGVQTLNNFQHVYGYASTAATDKAYLYGSSGADKMVGTTTYVYVSGGSGAHAYFNQALRYHSVIAYGSGGSDTATLYDSTGNDKFVSTSTYAYLSGGSGSTLFNNRVYNFAKVTANSSKGNDAAYFYDSAGNDTFTGQSAVGSMVGKGFSNTAKNFRTLVAYSKGGNDSARLYDATGSNTFTGSGSSAKLASGSVGTKRTATGFDSVLVIQSLGRNDRKVVGAVDYALTFRGVWL